MAKRFVEGIEVETGSGNVFADLGLPLEPRSFPVKEVRLIYRDKQYAFYGNPVFRIVRRDEFDHWLVREAEARGVTVHQGEAVTAAGYYDDVFARECTAQEKGDWLTFVIGQ